MKQIVSKARLPRSAPARRRGVTLLEMVFALALFVIVSTLVVGFFVRTLKLTSKENAYVELEQSTHFLLQKLETDLLNSGVAGLSYYPTDSADFAMLGVNRISDVTPEGDLVWRGSQMVYVQNKKTHILRRTEVNRSEGPRKTPLTFDAKRLEDIANMANSEDSVMADGVEEFQVINRGVDNSGRLVDVAISLSRKAPGNETRTYQVKKTVALRN